MILALPSLCSVLGLAADVFGLSRGRGRNIHEKHRDKAPRQAESTQERVVRVVVHFAKIAATSSQ